MPNQAPWLQASVGLTLITTPFTLFNFTKSVVLVATNVNLTDLPPSGAPNPPCMPGRSYMKSGNAFVLTQHNVSDTKRWWLSSACMLKRILD